MAKAEKKQKVNKLPEGMQANDLSLEKRTELYQAEFENFKKTTEEKYGLALNVEIVWTPRAAVPRLTLFDLLKKDGNQQEKQPE